LGLSGFLSLLGLSNFICAKRYALCSIRVLLFGEGNGFPLEMGIQSVKKRKLLPFLNLAQNQQNWKIVKKQ